MIGSTNDVSSCPDVVPDTIQTNLFRSHVICEAYAAEQAAAGAAAEAEKAALEAAKSCTPAVNCKDPPVGEHACQKDESGADPRYYCVLKTGDELVATEGAEAVLSGLGANEATSCSDVTQRGQSGVDDDGNVIYNYESTEICDAYAAMAEAGLTCVQETDCVADANGDKCALDTTDDKYKCTVAGQFATACTDITETSEGSGVFKSVEICDSFAAMKQAEMAALDAAKVCSPSTNCKDPTDGHACQVRVVGSGDEEANEYYCEMVGGKLEGSDIIFAADKFSSCPDITKLADTGQTCDELRLDTLPEAQQLAEDCGCDPITPMPWEINSW